MAQRVINLNKIKTTKHKRILIEQVKNAIPEKWLDVDNPRYKPELATLLDDCRKLKNRGQLNSILDRIKELGKPNDSIEPVSIFEVIGD